MSSLRSRYPALDAVTLTSQSLPRSLAGLGMDLFDLGVELSRAYQAGMSWPHDLSPEIEAARYPDAQALAAYVARDERGGNGG